MPDTETVQTPEQQPIEVEALCNNTNFTTIPNSTAEFCIYTYKAEHETHSQVLRPGFFDPAYSFVNVGDTIRVFRYNFDKVITHYMEFIVMKVDKVTREVRVAIVSNTKLENKIIE